MNTSTDAGNPRRAYVRAALWLWSSFILLSIMSAAAIPWAFLTSKSDRQRLEDGQALAEALEWPWPDFPGVTSMERETIQRQFKLEEPLMVADMRPWTVIPPDGPLAPRNPVALEQLAQAVQGILNLPPPTDLAALAGSGEETPYDPAIRALNRANTAQSNQWIVLYNRGVLNYRKESYATAKRDLEAALSVVSRYLENPPSAAVLEAAIHNYYALGHALARGGEGEPAELQAQRRSDAIKAFRESVRLLPRLLITRGPYGDVSDPLEFFQVEPTNLSSRSITSDLVAAYMGAPGFHNCEDKPEGDPCQARNLNKPCDYRDYIFCKSSRREGGPFGPPFRKLYHRFYDSKGGAWDQEHGLWALSNAVDRREQNSSLGDDPYILYNLGSLLVQAGEFEPAADLLDQGVASLTGSEPVEDSRRIIRVTAVANVLAGRAPRGSSRIPGKEDPSNLREIFRRFYGKDEELRGIEFAPVGSEFDASARSLLDRWLFLRLWRQLLNRGQFERFTQEYDRLLAEDDIPKEFFTRWHDEVLTGFGRRAFERAADLEGMGDRKQAQLVREFLSDNGHFPAELKRQARSGFGWAGWGWRKAWPWALTGLLLLLLTWRGVRARALLAAHRKTFYSVHRLSRLGKDAY